MLLEILRALAIGALLTQPAVLVTSIYLHRVEAHRSLALRKWVEIAFRSIQWLLTGISRQEWVAVHRKHHAFTDREGDPHSPRLLGFWKVQLGNVYYYSREARNPETIKKYGQVVVLDRLDRVLFAHKYGKFLGISLGTAGLCAILGWSGLLAAGFHAFTYVFVVSTSINGLCHRFGYKNKKDDTGAGNLRSVALATGGEGLHSNHHANPRNPKFSILRNEFDPSWIIIWCLLKLNLAWLYQSKEVEVL